jgi:hypothetical protein
MKNFHCCATCVHFVAEKQEKGMKYYCSRLKYDTKPNYQFNCWTPTEKVKKLMEKEK